MTGTPRIVVLAGGVGGSRFVLGVRGALRARGVDDTAAVLTVVVNTGDDLWLSGVRLQPDVDSITYALAGVNDSERGWGRRDESWRAKEELAAYGVEPTWFGLGDRDLATHLVRSEMLDAGYPLSAVTEALCDRWRPRVRLLPMTDDRVETHVVVDDEKEPSGRRAVHFQEYWIKMRAAVPARAVVPVGLDKAEPAPGVLESVAVTMNASRP